MPDIVTFTLPLSLAVLIVYPSFLKWPLISLLSSGIQARVIGRPLNSVVAPKAHNVAS
jgi:hypothetical protein